ncbi:MAG TPA: HAD family hydrolase [Conexivisphaerales archaeon]|nr:HAD family hydrolase [Conexivisphaerales archaeon]
MTEGIGHRSPGGKSEELGSPRALVIDFDRTLTDAELELYKPALRTLRMLQEEKGAKVIIATGRPLPFMRGLEGELSFVDAVVAENGAMVWLPRQGRVELLAEENGAKEALRSSGLPFEEGEAIVSVKKTLENRVLKLIIERKLDVDLQYNRDSLMLLPKGVDKVTGVRMALQLLGTDGGELICIGDGENDLALFALGTLKVATENAVQSLKDEADVVCVGAYAEGVDRFLRSLLGSAPKRG